MKYARIAGLGKYLPPKTLSNLELEKMVDTSDEWITTRTGIKTRHIAEKGTGVSSLALPAAQSALKQAGLNPKDLDLIIVATVTPDNQFPSTACYLQNYLKAEKAACLDVSAACSGFVYALVCAQAMLESGIYSNALVVGSEVLSTLTDWQDRSTCVLFGDGAGAAVLTLGEDKSFLSSFLGANGSYGNLIILPAGGSRNPATQETVKKRMHYIKMRGNELFRLAVRIMVKSAQAALNKAHLQSDEVDLLVPHQANLRIINAVAQRLKLNQDKIYLNIAQCGNMSSASSAVALCEAYQENRIKKGDIVLMDTFGSGLVWGSLVIKWV